MSTLAFSEGLSADQIKSLARSISIVENEVDKYNELLENIDVKPVPVIGITGPPGSGKSSIVSSMLDSPRFFGKSICVIAVDPSSPFNFGAILGDRVRVNKQYTDKTIYFRSLASRGSLGGLSEKIIEILEVCKSYPFDLIVVETVGVGQSEVEVAGLADSTILVLTPESGDQVQSMKAGVMEIADIFAINKFDHPKAASFANNLSNVLAFNQEKHRPVIEVIATEGRGVESLLDHVYEDLSNSKSQEKRIMLLADKIYRVIQKHVMEKISREKIADDLSDENISSLNIYRHIRAEYSDLFDF